MGGAVFPPWSLAWGQTMVGVMVVMVTFSKRTYARHHGSQDCCVQCPWLCGRPLSVHASARDSWTHSGKSGSVSCGVTEYSLEGLLLKLKFQHFDHLTRRTDSFEKTLMLGKIEGRRRRRWWGWDGWMASLTQWTWVWASSGSWWWTGKPSVRQSMDGVAKSQAWLSNWTELNWAQSRFCFSLKVSHENVMVTL